jgi:hypothetical protein
MEMCKQKLLLFQKGSLSNNNVFFQVQQGSIDTGAGRGGEEFGFPTTRNSSCGRHPWNLKILSNNHRSLLRCMGPVMGVTVPTLHVGMLFSTGIELKNTTVLHNS